MTPHDYAILPASEAHIGLLELIEREAGSRFGSSLPAHVLVRTVPLEVLADAQREGRLWVAVDTSGEPVGFALAEVVAGRAYLDELDVLPQHGRRGVGVALISTVEQWALAQGCTELALTTFVDVPWNADYYAKVGFEAIPESDLYLELRRRLDDEEDAGLERARRVAMRKRLSAAAWVD
jgi:GNAT superfamily N-acetyltransferase